MPRPPELIGSAEACKILSEAYGRTLQRSTLTRWIKSGRLTYWVRAPGDNGAFLFDKTVIVAFAKELRARAA